MTVSRNLTLEGIKEHNTYSLLSSNKNPMTNLLAAIRKLASSAHRAIWRVGIIVPVAMAAEVALWHDVDDMLHKGSTIVVLFPFYILYEVFNIIKEYRHPRPKDLGISGHGVVLGAFLVFTVLVNLVRWPLHYDDLSAEWPWMMLVVIAALLAHLLRPRPRK